MTHASSFRNIAWAALSLLAARGIAAAAMAAASLWPLGQAGAATPSAPSQAADHSFSFALLGDTPAAASDETLLPQVLAQIGNEADFVIHIGNIKGEHESCDDAMLDKRQALLAASPVPLVLTPGDQDWADCDHESAGRFSPVERLNRMREALFDSPQSLGMVTIDVQRQSDTVRFRGYAENARWEYGHIVFATLNMPGNHNNFRRGAGRNGEYEERIMANGSWLRQAFATATHAKAKGLVLAFHANPHFGGSKEDVSAGEGRDPYGDFKNTLARLASKFPGQVLVVHGSDKPANDPPRPDQPVKFNGKVLTNVVRVQTYGSPLSQYWIKVDVDPARKAPFRVETRTAVLAAPHP
jgi:hypothetical protein